MQFCAYFVFLRILGDQGPVHTNPFSNENGAVLLRIRLFFTLQRRKLSPKAEPLESALQSGCGLKPENSLSDKNGKPKADNNPKLTRTEYTYTYPLYRTLKTDIY